MQSEIKLAATDAEVVLFTKGGRDFRMERLLAGEEVPREFFYGYFELARAGTRAAFLSSSGRQPGSLGFGERLCERNGARRSAIVGKTFGSPDRVAQSDHQLYRWLFTKPWP
jgi:hypothetical protein